VSHWVSAVSEGEICKFTPLVSKLLRGAFGRDTTALPTCVVSTVSCLGSLILNAILFSISEALLEEEHG